MDKTPCITGFLLELAFVLNGLRSMLTAIQGGA